VLSLKLLLKHKMEHWASPDFPENSALADKVGRRWMLHASNAAAPF
jgi:hypothetical protein